MDIKAVLGQNLKTFRKEKALSQEAVAYSCDISVSTYARIEQGKRNCCVETVRKISEVLEVSPCRLMAETCHSPKIYVEETEK